MSDLKVGDSIAINGVCLTVISISNDRFEVEATAGTLSVSNIGALIVGKRVNVERALRVSDRLGGHIVQGHIDGIGKVSKIRFGSGSTIIEVELPSNLRKYIVDKGSITIEGVSLTVSEKTVRGFRINIIPHTLENTTLKDLRPGDKVNIETDIIIRWLSERLETLVGSTPALSDPSVWGSIHRED